MYFSRRFVHDHYNRCFSLVPQRWAGPVPAKELVQSKGRTNFVPPLTSPMSLGFIQFGPNPKVVLEIAPKSHCTMPMRLAPEVYLLKNNFVCEPQLIRYDFNQKLYSPTAIQKKYRKKCKTARVALLRPL